MIGSKLQFKFLCAYFFGFLFPLFLFAAPKISPDELKTEIGNKILSVSQFKFIKELGQKMGVRVWLFGGTAAGFGHYVRWDLERRKGDTTYQAEKFDYNYLNIYRPSQDCDLVIDGTAAQAGEFEDAIQKEFPHLQGNKVKWEVRLLDKERGDKEALLKNRSFLSQNTDSNSIGLIELTDSAHRVRDLRNWNSESPGFLEDLAAGRIRYLPSENHEKTKRFKEGKNPHIFSVIRFLVKVLQYDLEISPEDRAAILKKINAFQSSDLTTPYAREWLEKNGIKLFHQTVDLERAGKILKELGLRNKLLKLGDVQEADSMAWWLNREPLETQEIRYVKGAQTAADLGISIVAHETRDFFAYEAIMKSPRGLPNVFISRERAAGESAAHGDGFYTRIGREGARGTGFTIRFEVDPKSVEGRDFKKHGDYIVVLNRAILKVIPESLNVDVRTYLRLVQSQDWKSSDRGMLERFKYLVKIDGISNQKEVIDDVLYRMAEIKHDFKRTDLKKDRQYYVSGITYDGSKGYDDSWPRVGYPFPRYAIYMSELVSLFGNKMMNLEGHKWTLGDFFELARRLRRPDDSEFIENILKTLGPVSLFNNEGDFLSLYKILSTAITDRSIYNHLYIHALNEFSKLEIKRREKTGGSSKEWVEIMDGIRLTIESQLKVCRCFTCDTKEFGSSPARIGMKPLLEWIGSVLRIPNMENELRNSILEVENQIFKVLNFKSDSDYLELEEYFGSVFPRLEHSHLLALLDAEFVAVNRGEKEFSWSLETNLELAGLLFTHSHRPEVKSILVNMIARQPIETIRHLWTRLDAAGMSYYSINMIYYIISAAEAISPLAASTKMEISKELQRFINSARSFKPLLRAKIRSEAPALFLALKYYLAPRWHYYFYYFLRPSFLKYKDDRNRNYSSAHYKKALNHLLSCKESVIQLVKEKDAVVMSKTKT